MPASSPSPAHGRLIRQLESITALTADDRAQLASLPLRIAYVAQRHDIVRQGDKPTDCCLIIEGLACRYKTVAGGRRQILSIHHPGDLPDLQSLHLERMDHGVMALAATKVAFIPHPAIRTLVQSSFTLDRALRRQEHVDASVFREWVANIGQRDATARVGHLFCEVFARMRALGLDQGRAISLSMTQAELGEATGISPVHVNRVMQQLRNAQFISSHGQTHTILDWPGLQHASDFDPAYLHLRSEAPQPALI